MKNIQVTITVMKYNKFPAYVLLLLLCNMVLPGCVKNNDAPGVASLNIFNGIVGSDTLVANLKDGTSGSMQWFRTANFLFYGKAGNPDYTSPRNNNQFNSYSGNQRFTFFHYPDTLSHHTPVIDIELNLPVGSMNSLFFTGTLHAPDTFFIRDQLPYHALTDSVTSIRVVNLLPGVTASVNLKGNAPGSELSSLAYKTASAFKDYSVTGSGDLYEFEIREASSGTILTSFVIDTRNNVFNVNPFRFKNYTLIIYGQQGGTGSSAPGAVLMKNF